jgi:ligand-binding sensor domain-containing protein
MPQIKTINSSAYLLYCLLTAFSASAQQPIRLNFHHLSTKSGLSSMYVRKIVQDPFGFMWIGTEDGLNRFDGKNFVIYNKGIPGRHSLTGLDTRDLLTDTLHHTIWEINSFGGIDGIDYITGNTDFSYRQSDSRATADIVFNSLALAGDSLYIGTSGGLFILRIAEKQFSKVPLNNPLQPDAALSIDKVLRDIEGRLWLFCRNQGLLVLRKGTPDVLDHLPAAALEPAPAGIEFFDCTLLPDGAVLSATSAGLRLFALTGEGKLAVRDHPFPGIALSQGRPVYSCRQDKNGLIWFSTAGYLVRTNASGTSFTLVKEHTTGEALSWLGAVFDVCFDKDDNVWLGCQAGLAYAQDLPSCFTSITSSAVSQTTIHHTYYLYPVNDSILYCCAQEGLYKVDAGKGIIDCLDNTRPYYQAFIDPRGLLLVSSIDGIYVYSRGHMVPLARIFPEFRPLKKLAIDSHCVSGDSVLVFGTRDRGIVIWNYRRHKVKVVDIHTPDIWLKDNYVSTVYTDHKGLIWILGYKSISLLDLSRRTVHSVNTYDPVRNTYYTLLFDVCEARGRYYVASYGGGVFVLDSNYRFIRELSTNDGLAANSVYKVIPYKDSLLFITSNNGLSVANIRLHERVRNYYESDGLHSDNFEQYSGAICNDIVYAGGADGLTVIDPSLFTKPAPPPAVYVRDVTTQTESGINDTSNLLMSSLDIPENALQATVYFSSIGYRNPERCRLSYKIREIKEDWTDIGTQNFIPFIGVRPGRYTLMVRSAGADGNWSDRPIQLTLRFLPKWYQTLWFDLLVIALAAGLFYAFYRYRIGQLQKQQQIRKDIASDLHDDIGSTLNSVKIFTHLARREQDKDVHLVRIEESITAASSGLRDLIWVLDDSKDTIPELLDRIRKFALPVCQANQIHFNGSYQEDLNEKTLTKPAKRNLLLIIKEALNNSIKYSGCSHLSLTIAARDSKLVFIIHDDGKGFDPSGVVPGEGLKNIRQRADQVRFALQIVSSPGAGTTIELEEK